MKTFKLLIVVVTGMLLFAGCSATGSGGLNASSVNSNQKRVVLRPNTDARAAEHMPEVTAALRRNGFVVVSEGTAPYEVRVSFVGGGWDLTCSIIMYEKGVPIVSGKGTNPGFGVWMARDGAYRGVFQRALSQFEERLGGR